MGRRNRGMEGCDIVRGLNVEVVYDKRLIDFIIVEERTSIPTLSYARPVELVLDLGRRETSHDDQLLTEATTSSPFLLRRPKRHSTVLGHKSDRNPYGTLPKAFRFLSCDCSETGLCGKPSKRRRNVTGHGEFAGWVMK